MRVQNLLLHSIIDIQAEPPSEPIRIDEITIKLRGFGPRPVDQEELQRVTQALENFMQQWQSQTRPNPYNPRQRIVGNNRAVIELRPFGRSIHLADIRTVTPRAGGGTEGLELIKQIADRTGASISGSVKAYKINHPVTGQEMKTPSTARLVQWYRNCGFDVDADGTLSYTPIQVKPELNESSTYMAAWILPDGEVLTGHRHEKIAADYFESQEHFGEKVDSSDPYQLGWVRALLVESTFGADYEVNPTRLQWDTLRMLIRDSQSTDVYINPRGRSGGGRTPMSQRDALVMIREEIIRS